MSSTLEAGRSRNSPLSQRALDDALFVLVPALVTCWLIYRTATGGLSAVDFRQVFWVAAHRVLHGGDPYGWSRGQILAGVSFPYPAPCAVLLAPLALLPVGIAADLATAGCLGAIVGALRLAHVTDRRVVGICLLWLPVVLGWQTANLTLPLALGLAAVWRSRDHPTRAGLLTALLVSIKPIILPLVLWLVATRRYRAAARAIAGGIAINAVAWSVVGFSELPRWLALVSRQGTLLYHRGYAVGATLAHLGFARSVASSGAIVLVALVATACVWAARRGHDAGAFTLAVGLTIVASPQVDAHYFALLAVPLALARPRLATAWLLPLVLWVCPATAAATWQELTWWLVAIATVVQVLLRPEPAESPAWRPIQRRIASAV